MFAEDVAIRRYSEHGNNIVHWSEFETRRPFRRHGFPGPARQGRARVLPRFALARKTRLGQVGWLNL